MLQCAALIIGHFWLYASKIRLTFVRTKAGVDMFLFLISVGSELYNSGAKIRNVWFRISSFERGTCKLDSDALVSLW